MRADFDYEDLSKPIKRTTAEESNIQITPEQWALMDELFKTNDRIRLTVVKQEYQALVIFYYTKRREISNQHIESMVNFIDTSVILMPAYKAQATQIVNTLRAKQQEFASRPEPLTVIEHKALFEEVQEVVQQAEFQINELVKHEKKLKNEFARIVKEKVKAEKAIDDIFLPKIRELEKEIGLLTEKIEKDMVQGLEDLSALLEKLPIAPESKLQFEKLLLEFETQIKNYKKADPNEKQPHLKQCAEILRNLTSMIRGNESLKVIHEQLQGIQQLIDSDLLKQENLIPEIPVTVIPHLNSGFRRSRLY